jgi:hypothetical protein
MKPEDRALLIRKLRALADALEADEAYAPGLYAYRPAEGYTVAYGVDEARKIASPSFEDDPEVDSHEWGVLVPVEVARVTVEWVEHGQTTMRSRSLLDASQYTGPWVTGP